MHTVLCKLTSWLATRAGITKTPFSRLTLLFYFVNCIAENDTVEVVLDGKLEQV